MYSFRRYKHFDHHNFAKIHLLTQFLNVRSGWKEKPVVKLLKLMFSNFSNLLPTSYLYYKLNVKILIWYALK